MERTKKPTRRKSKNQIPEMAFTGEGALILGLTEKQVEAMESHQLKHLCQKIRERIEEQLEEELPKCPHGYAFKDDCEIFNECKLENEREEVRRDPGCPKGFKLGRDLDKREECQTCGEARKEACRKKKDRFQRKVGEKGELIAHKPHFKMYVEVMRVQLARGFSRHEAFLDASLFGLIESMVKKEKGKKVQLELIKTNREIAEAFGEKTPRKIAESASRLVGLKLVESRRKAVGGDARRRVLKVGRDWKAALEWLWRIHVVAGRRADGEKPKKKMATTKGLRR